MSVSVIIAARNEELLNATLRNLLEGGRRDLEIVVVLDGPTAYPLLDDYPLTVIQNESPLGLRACLNQAVAASTGEHLLRIDAHCIFSPDFVDTLLADLAPDQVMVARRWTLDLSTMQPTPRRVDYFYLSCPWTHPKFFLMQSCPWISRTEAMFDRSIDDLMCFQGSMWMMSRAHWNWLGGIEQNELTYVEHHEISFKTWLGGRRVVINKNAWYAHPAVRPNSYHLSQSTMNWNHVESAKYWVKQPGYADLIERFWPLPLEHTRTHGEKYFWPEDWRKYLAS